MKFSYEPFDLSGVGTYPLATRKSKTNAADFATPFRGEAARALLDSLPSILAGSDLKAIVRAMREARAAGHGIVWGIGAHVIKTGVAPVLIDLMERGYVSISNWRYRARRRRMSTKRSGRDGSAWRKRPAAI